MKGLLRRWRDRHHHRFEPTDTVEHVEDLLGMPEGGFMDVGFDERLWRCYCGAKRWEREDP